MTLALRDAIATARVRIAEERNAIHICESHGCTTDARFARSELAHYEALLARLLDKALNPAR